MTQAHSPGWESASPPARALVTDELLPVRMLAEFAYCPRLFHLMYVEGRWADNVYTVEGKVLHRRVDQLDQLLPAVVQPCQADSPAEASPGALPAPSVDPAVTSADRLAEAGDEPPVISRSVPLSNETLGLTARLDLVATANDEAVPVEIKRGRVPNIPQRCYEPERVQLMAQGLLLREAGYRCDHGVLYFAGSRTRVDVPFTPELEDLTRHLIIEARQAATRRSLPEPLENSSKCIDCSLNGICLPDETLALRHTADTSFSDIPESHPHTIRRLYPARDDAAPFYIQHQGATLGKRGDQLVVSARGTELARKPIKDVAQIVLCGNIMVTAQTLHTLCEAGIPVVHLSMGNWFYGITHGINLRNAYDRAAQFQAAGRIDLCLAFARDLVAAKGINQRTLLRRNGQLAAQALADMNDLIDRIPSTESIDALLGLEGRLAALYFQHFSTMLRPRDFSSEWDFTVRNRRPPRDPINALLSFGYALLVKECTIALLAEGLDPWWGLYHRPRHGRPALALDLMEPFRPVVVDSAVITAVNTGMIQVSSFTIAPAGCMLRDTGRKAFIQAYESRLEQLVTHPVFDYRCSWRSMIRLHARLVSRWLRGDVPRFESITTR